MNGFWAVLIKEFTHIRRSRTTIFFTFVVPALQLTIFGYAIRITIEHIPMAVYDLDGSQESRQLTDAFVSTGTFQIVAQVHDMDSFHRTLDSGRARVGLLIPPDYSERLLNRQQAPIQVLVDGSDSQVAMTAQNTVMSLTTNLSFARAKAMGEAMQLAPARDPAGRAALAIDPRVRLLYNPNLESAYFFVPGLVAIILQLVLLFLTSFSIVRERELGTLEQIFVTPVGRAGLILGKLTPYTIMAFGELLLVLFLMVAVFHVPIHGDLLLLLILCTLFIVTVLGLGLLISTLATTHLEAMQFAFIVMMPSILLSGFMFPRSEMPIPIYLLTYLLPATYFIEILRGIILRGADLWDLWPHVLGLAVCASVILTLSIRRFRKQLD